MPRSLRPLFALVALAVIAACSGGDAPQPGTNVIAVKVSPDNPVLTEGDTLTFVAMAILENGESRDVSDAPGTSWESSDASTLSVNADGTAEANDEGEAYVTARVSGITSPAQRVVVNPAPTTPSPTPTPTPAPTANHVVISEVMFNPTGTSESSYEYIELHNPTGSTVNVTGWDIVVRSSTDPFVTLPSLSIPSMAYVVISRESVNFPTRYGVAPDATLSFATLSNGGGWIVLRDGSDATVDEMAWGSGASGISPSKPTSPPWCVTNDPTASTDGTSVSRIPDGADGDTCNDWSDSTTATPAAAN